MNRLTNYIDGKLQRIDAYLICIQGGYSKYTISPSSMALNLRSRPLKSNALLLSSVQRGRILNSFVLMISI